MTRRNIWSSLYTRDRHLKLILRVIGRKSAWPKHSCTRFWEKNSKLLMGNKLLQSPSCDPSLVQRGILSPTPHSYLTLEAARGQWAPSKNQIGNKSVCNIQITRRFGKHM
ncbi:hypothetical protein AVEN_160723-1 [Araneus ventricosus]|uniref:Uncharacterized protein n=1 Tax=Araneus ventricosus TaxID=182803 RepID=A0A4Y2NER9_ARAVE|nr:hypothetical protein AVEN_160723-1 [Araneus ventricosus]